MTTEFHNKIGHIKSFRCQCEMLFNDDVKFNDETTEEYTDVNMNKPKYIVQSETDMEAVLSKTCQKRWNYRNITEL